MKAKKLAEEISKELKLFLDMDIKIKDSTSEDELEVEDIEVSNGIVIIRTNLADLLQKIYDEGFDDGTCEGLG